MYRVLIIVLFLFILSGQDKQLSGELLKQENSVRKGAILSFKLGMDESEKLVNKKKFKEAIEILDKLIAQLKGNRFLNKKVIETTVKKINLFKANTLIKWAQYNISKKSKGVNLEDFDFSLSLINGAIAIVDDNKFQKIKEDLFKDKIVKNRELDAQIEKIIDRQGELDSNSEGIIRKRYLVSIHLERGKAFFNIKNYTLAIKEFEKALALDINNIVAINYSKDIYLKLKDHARDRKNLVKSETKARSSWNWVLPVNLEQESIITDVDTRTVETQGSPLDRKLKIYLPSFRVDGTVGEALERLKNLSKLVDREKEGVNFIISDLELKDGSSPIFKDENDLEEKEADNSNSYVNIEDRKITIDLTNIPVEEILKYISSGTNLKYSVQKYAILITDKDDIGDDLQTNFFSADTNFIELIRGSSDDGEADVKSYFESLGIKFPPKSQIRYIAAFNRLVVTNTQENLNRVKEVLTQLSIAPKQVNIETKFVEFSAEKYDEVGFKWFFGRRPATLNSPSLRDNDKDRIIIAQQPYDSTPNSTISNSITNSTRDSGLSSAVSFAGLGRNSNLSQYHFQTLVGSRIYDTLVRLIDQENTTEILSTPKITTTNGETARIRVATERYFPESWDSPQVNINTTGLSASSPITITPSLPQFAPPRDIGVTMEVTPQIDPDGYSIQLQVKPAVTEFLRYDNDFNADLILSGGPNVTLETRFDVPIISTRELESNVLLYDGESVVLGGLNRERIIKRQDRIPILSDIPLIGRLFNSNSSFSDKRSLVIFVSARLITPSNLPVRPNNVRGLPDFRQF